MSNHSEDNSGARIGLNLIRRGNRNEDCPRERRDERGPGGDVLVCRTPDGGRNGGRGGADCDPEPRRQERERAVPCDRLRESEMIARPMYAPISREKERGGPTLDFEAINSVGAGCAREQKRNCEYAFHAWILIGVLAALLLGSCASAPHPLPSSDPLSSLAAAGPYPVARYEVEWFDVSRNRRIPALLYAPVGPTSLPVIIFSHGLGNSRLGYSYLGEHWASHGYVSVHPEHPGANTEVERHGLWKLFRAGFDRRNWRNVPLDIHFAIDQLQNDAALPEALRGRVDRSRIGVFLGVEAALRVGSLST